MYTCRGMYFHFCQSKRCNWSSSHLASKKDLWVNVRTTVVTCLFQLEMESLMLFDPHPITWVIMHV